jgi:hypothetical protein
MSKKISGHPKTVVKNLSFNRFVILQEPNIDD